MVPKRDDSRGAGEAVVSGMGKKQPEKTELEKRWEAELSAAEASQTDDTETAVGKVEATDETKAAEADIDALAAERDALKDQLLRARAEFDNYRKRTARENEQMRARAAQDLIGDLLPVLDNLERAVAHADGASGGLAEGVEMVLRQLSDALGRHGVKAIEAVGEPFDPSVHEAVMRKASETHPADVVVEEFQRGYRLGTFVLRPSKVVVSGGPSVSLDREQNVADCTGAAEGADD